MLSDTINLSGNFLISNLLEFYLKNSDKVIFMAFQNNYAHYLTISKKLGMNIEPHLKKDNLFYIDGVENIIDWVPLDIPFTEDRPWSWADLPKKAYKFQLSTKKYFENLIKEIVKKLDEEDNCK